jgi:murein DD-endopeptidase MepM/ murein hydrolase activator NlpD
VSAKAFGVSSDCATETGRYAASGRVVASGSNRYFGLVQGEGVTGKVVIVQHGRSLSVSVTSRRGSAKLSLSR